MNPSEAQTRKKLIDGQISKAGWNLLDRNQVRFEVPASGVLIKKPRTLPR